MYAARSMATASTVTTLKIVLPLVGLSILPLAGLVYAASASFGPKTKASSSASASAAKKSTAKPADDLDGPEAEGDTTADTKPAKAPAVSKPGAGRPIGNNAVGHNKAAQQTFCCEKLSDMARSASPQDKATLSAAASACSASPNWEGALKQIMTVVDGAFELPNECQNH